MFDEMEDEIDAVIVATPDHTHSVAAINALKRKHLYCEKPLCHSIYETRVITDGRGSRSDDQMGNQGHSSDETGCCANGLTIVLWVRFGKYSRATAR